MSACDPIANASELVIDPNNRWDLPVWMIIVGAGASYVGWGMGKQLYAAAMEGYILTGRSMKRRVYRGENRSLFRNNVVVNIAMFPIVSAGAVMILLSGLSEIGLID